MAQKSVEGAHITLDATPKTTTKDIIRPYTYHKKIINISGLIQLPVPHRRLAQRNPFGPCAYHQGGAQERRSAGEVKPGRHERDQERRNNNRSGGVHDRSGKLGAQ